MALFSSILMYQRRVFCRLVTAQVAQVLDEESLSIHMEAVEAVVRGWSRSAIIAGIHATTATRMAIGSLSPPTNDEK